MLHVYILILSNMRITKALIRFWSAPLIVICTPEDRFFVVQDPFYRGFVYKIVMLDKFNMTYMV